jgi:hypothetical protein
MPAGGDCHAGGREAAHTAASGRRRNRLDMLVFAAAAFVTAASASDEMLQKWFNHPFFQTSSAVLDCPVPAGPFTSEQDRRVQAHRRAEKGTTCWLARECDRPNAYVYDPDIALAFKAAALEHPSFANTTLWVTVQGRVVYLEGCVQQASQAVALEAFAMKVPNVQRAIAIVRSDPATRAPYPLRVPVTSPAR